LKLSRPSIYVVQMFLIKKVVAIFITLVNFTKPTSPNELVILTDKFDFSLKRLLP